MLWPLGSDQLISRLQRDPHLLSPSPCSAGVMPFLVAQLYSLDCFLTFLKPRTQGPINYLAHQGRG